jgi:hypothetical protein
LLAQNFCDKMSDQDIWNYVARLGVQMRGASDDFFAEGDAVCAMRTCQYLTQIDVEELLHRDFDTFPCSVPGCQAKFSQLIDSEAHYNARHRHSCNTCKKSLPSAHLLDLHVAENHDSYFQLLSAKKPSYECFLETCKDLKFWNSEERREHCISSHLFPSDFKHFDTTTTTKSNNKKKSVKKDQHQRKVKAGSSSPKEVRLRSSAPGKKSLAGKPRPASVFVDAAHATAPMDTDDIFQQEVLPKVSSIKNLQKTFESLNGLKSKLPVYERRLSLNVSTNKTAAGTTNLDANRRVSMSPQPVSLNIR